MLFVSVSVLYLSCAVISEGQIVLPLLVYSSRVLPIQSVLFNICLAKFSLMQDNCLINLHAGAFLFFAPNVW